MATFGTTSSAGSSTGGASNLIIGTKYTLSENGTVDKLTVYSPTTGNIKGAIYADSGGAPGSLVISNATGYAVTGGNWVDIPLTSTYLAAGTYWLVFISDTNNMRAFVSGSSNQAAYNTSTTYAGGFPGTFPTPTYQSVDYIAYATYSVPGVSSMLLESDEGEMVMEAVGSPSWETPNGEALFVIPGGGGGGGGGGGFYVSPM